MLLRRAYAQGLAIDPTSAQLAAGVAEARAAAARAAEAANGAPDALGAMFSSPDAAAKLAASPKTAAFMAKPDFVALLASFRADPSIVGKHLGDARVLKSLGVLMGVNMSSGDEFMQDAEAHAPSHPPPAQPPPPAEELSPEEAALREAKAAAAVEKEAGNSAYKQKRLDEALGHYDAAIALDGADVSFRTNRAAVLFEKGEYAACAAECDAALELAHAQRADFKTVARALTRKGNALAKLGDLEGAIAAYSKSLTEHRTADTLARLNAAEKTLRDARQAAYEDPVAGAAAREEGNVAFKAGRFPEAVVVRRRARGGSSPCFRASHPLSPAALQRGCEAQPA